VTARASDSVVLAVDFVHDTNCFYDYESYGARAYQKTILIRYSPVNSSDASAIRYSSEQFSLSSLSSSRLLAQANAVDRSKLGID